MGEMADKAREAIVEAEASNDVLNLVDVIAAHCGWKPLVIGESMTVGFGDRKEYTITRNDDRK